MELMTEARRFMAQDWEPSAWQGAAVVMLGEVECTPVARADFEPRLGDQSFYHLLYRSWCALHYRRDGAADYPSLNRS